MRKYIKIPENLNTEKYGFKDYLGKIGILVNHNNEIYILIDDNQHNPEVVNEEFVQQLLPTEPNLKFLLSTSLLPIKEILEKLIENNIIKISDLIKITSKT